MSAALPADAEERVPGAVRPSTPAAQAWARLRRRPSAMVGLAVILLVVAAAVFAPWIAPYDPIQQSWSAVRKAPSAAYWFGTDEVGRDILSRILYGARASLLAGVVSVAIAIGIGVPVGLLAGTYLAEYARGSRLGDAVRFVSDVLLSAPSILIGLFVYQVLVLPFGGFSGIAGAVALAVIIVPIVVRTTEDWLREAEE